MCSLIFLAMFFGSICWFSPPTEKFWTALYLLISQLCQIYHHSKLVIFFIRSPDLSSVQKCSALLLSIFMIIIPGVEGTVEMGGKNEETDALLDFIIASADMLCTSRMMGTKHNSNRTTMDLVVEMDEKVNQSLQPKRRRKSYADPKNLNALMKGVKFMEDINKSAERCTVTEGPDGNSIFMHNIEEVATVVGVSATNIRKAMPQNIDKYHKKVRIEENGTKKYTFGPGESSTLGEVGERELVEWIDELFDRGYPPEWGDVHAAALSIAKWQGNDNFNASNGWRARFIKRHPEVCTRVVENLHRTRVGGMNSDNVKEYFQILEQYVEKVEKANGHKLRGDEILNIDETGFDLSNCSKTLRVVIKTTKYKRHRRPQHQGSADRTHFSAAICIDASGHRYPTHYCSVGEINPYLMPGTECVSSANGYYTEFRMMGVGGF